PQSRNAILETVGALGIAVLYTTHYMEEAAKLCQRIGIIDEGRLIAEGTPEGLIAQHGGQDRLRLTFAAHTEPALAEACELLDSVHTVTSIDRGLELSTDHGPKVLPEVVKAAGEHGVELTGVDVMAPDLEVVFLHLTGKELRD
ncbi:MAG TPA: export ABC transporter ATP-binding protein, partial [Acidimicrobiales bacterium]